MRVVRGVVVDELHVYPRAARDNDLTALVDITHKKPGQNPPVSYDQFLKFISTQTKSLQQKFGCSAVAFNLALEKDAVKFTARAEDVHLP